MSELLKVINTVAEAVAQPLLPPATATEGMRLRRQRFGDQIEFYAPGLKRWQTAEWKPERAHRFLPISVTGTACALSCDHCETKVLQGMITVSREKGLFDTAAELQSQGTEGILVSGGSNKDGGVPLLPHVDDMRRVREELGMKVIVHSGVVSPRLARGLAEAEVDGVMLDIIGADETIDQVYHLDLKAADFERSLELLSARKMRIIPHIVIGLHFGKLLKKIYDGFWMNVATNGLRKIPLKGFEKMPIGVSVWGSPETDRRLRGSGKVDVFQAALDNYRNDPRAFFYYTVAPGDAREIPEVVERCLENGNRVLFNFYGDLQAGTGGGADFSAVQREIEKAISRHPESILITSYLSRVVTSGRLYDQRWGWEVCTSITADHRVNARRIANGNPYNPHFRAYNADLASTRRCCTGIDRDCSSCFDVWERFSWVMMHLRRHLASEQEFTCWLTTMYLFYLINRIVDAKRGMALLPEIHRRLDSLPPLPQPTDLRPGGSRESSPAGGGQVAW